jgi:K+ transporter
MCFSRARMRYYWDERVRHVSLSGPVRVLGSLFRRLRKSLFATMHLNANLPAAYFGVPAAQVVEVGLEVEI